MMDKVVSEETVQIYYFKDSLVGSYWISQTLIFVSTDIAQGRAEP
jgi:hypothetical protein